MLGSKSQMDVEDILLSSALLGNLFNLPARLFCKLKAYYWHRMDSKFEKGNCTSCSSKQLADFIACLDSTHQYCLLICIYNFMMEMSALLIPKKVRGLCDYLVSMD